MTTVITYGTFDLLHYGHIRLLERAKALGDYLIVGVTADDFDKVRGKINVQQSLMERIEAVQKTGLADKIVVEEYDGQKIDDIHKYDVDIFTLGSDWKGKFDYLNEYCRVVYLDRTEGVSSSDVRSQSIHLKMGMVGESTILNKYYRESCYVNGIAVTGVFSADRDVLKNSDADIEFFDSYDELLEKSDVVYIVSHPEKHYSQVKQALERGKHVLCESPVALSEKECRELFLLADSKQLILMDAIKTAYSTAYNRLLLMLKGGKIGEIVSVDATCTSLKNTDAQAVGKCWNSICSWGPTALLPIFQLVGLDWEKTEISSMLLDEQSKFDLFTHIDFLYPSAVASVKVGVGVKSEGELIVSGTKGYAYVPAPWWKTDYFEIRFENQENNQRYFYQLDGEGIRYELAAFVRAVKSGNSGTFLNESISFSICRILENFYSGNIRCLNKKTEVFEA